MTLVSISKTLNHDCYILQMGCEAVGPVCSVVHIKEPNALNRNYYSYCYYCM